MTEAVWDKGVEAVWDEAVENIHRAFCDPEHELVGEWDQEMAAALKRNGYAIVRVEQSVSHEHVWTDIRNEVVLSGEACIDRPGFAGCGALRAGNS